MIRRALWGAVLGGALLLHSAAQAADPRLAARLQPATAEAVTRTVDQAAADGLPTEPLVAKALEGAAKRAPGPRIVAAVQEYAAALAEARAALGLRSSEAEIVAGAGALMADVPRDTLVKLRAARPGRSLTIPLVVLADLVARKVPPGAASAAVLKASRAGAPDSDLLLLRERVEHDIRSGASPLTSVTLRSQALSRPPARSVPGGRP